jgi:hypothetical protein
MNGEISTEVIENIETPKLRPIRSVRMVAVAFAFFCYVTFAALYFSRPNKPLISLGQLRLTMDTLLELVFTILTLPAFGMAYLYGVRKHEENSSFAVPESAIDFLFVAAIAWVAVGNGIHLTAKLNEQMIAIQSNGQWSAIRASFHWTRQVVGHVLPHIGWQVLFSALMLGQLKRPYRGQKPKNATWFFGGLFGLLFAHGAIAGTCTHIGFVLTAVSCLGFLYLGHKSKFLPGEIPILRFFFYSQVTFLLAVAVYWSVSLLGLVPLTPTV